LRYNLSRGKRAVDDPVTFLVVCAAVAAVAILLLMLGRGASDKDRGTEVARTDAEHFSILLVKEIIEYNKDKVREAREKGNIMVALGDEINRARLMYQQRFGAPRAGERDYFREALIKILAGGNKRALGRPH
jgi:hypothetical protein